MKHIPKDRKLLLRQVHKERQYLFEKIFFIQWIAKNTTHFLTYGNYHQSSPGDPIPYTISRVAAPITPEDVFHVTLVALYFPAGFPDIDDP